MEITAKIREASLAACSTRRALPERLSLLFLPPLPLLLRKTASRPPTFPAPVQVLQMPDARCTFTPLGPEDLDLKGGGVVKTTNVHAKARDPLRKAKKGKGG